MPTLSNTPNRLRAILLTAVISLMLCGCTSVKEKYVQWKIDRIQSKTHVTQRDIDFVRENSLHDWDMVWCSSKETELKYDVLQRMRKKIGEDKQNEEIATLFVNEWQLYEEYCAAAVNAYTTVCEVYAIGSGVSRGICISDINGRCLEQYVAANLVPFQRLCGEKPNVECHQHITWEMIETAYSKMIDAQQDCEYPPENIELSRKSKQDSLRKEQLAFKRWMDFRAELSLWLPENIRKDFDNSTNNVMKLKLIQLKNQYHNIGIYGGDIMRCWLPEDCSDEDLASYPSFDSVWSVYLQHLDDSEWKDWKRCQRYNAK